MAAPAEPARVRDRARFRRQLFVVVGVLLTFLGLALLAVLVPIDPAGLLHLLPYVAGGALALWVGGILLGWGMRGRGRRSRG